MKSQDTITYPQFPIQVRQFLESYFSGVLSKYSSLKSDLESLYISFEERPSYYSSIIKARLELPDKIHYYDSSDVNWSGVVHEATHLIQSSLNGVESDIPLPPQYTTTSFLSLTEYREDEGEKHAFKVQEDFKKTSWQEVTWDQLRGWLVKEKGSGSYCVVSSTYDSSPLEFTMREFGRSSKEEQAIKYIGTGTFSHIFKKDLSELIPIRKIEDTKKLSWKETPLNPEDYVGWLVKENTEQERPFGVILKIEYIAFTYHIWSYWSDSEERALKDFKLPDDNMDYSKEYIEITADEFFDYIIPIRYIGLQTETSLKSLSWEEVPEDLTGWMIYDKKNENLPDCSLYCIVDHVQHESFGYYVKGYWGINEVEAINEMKISIEKKWNKDSLGYVYIKDEEELKNKIIPIRYIGLNKQASSNNDFTSYKDQNKKMYVERSKYYEDKDGGKIFWSSPNAQSKRFEALIDIGDLNDKEILDVGMGHADLLSFIEHKGIELKKYTGVDIVEEIVEKARELHPNTNLEVRDIQKDPIENNSFDYVFGSGIFALNTENWNEYVVDMLKSMLSIARLGVSVNFLKKSSLPEGTLRHNDPQQVLNLIKHQVTSKAVLKEGYLDDDFSIFLYKDIPGKLSWQLIDNDFTSTEVNKEGSRFFYNDKGQYHRLSGPAIEWGNGDKAWWVDDKRIGSSRGGFTDEKFEDWKREHPEELTKLSWQDLDDPTDLTGWLISFTTFPSEMTGYKVITRVDRDKLYGPIYSYSEERAIASIGSENEGYINNDMIKKITPIRKILDIKKKSWQEVPENLEGWLVAIKMKYASGTIYKVVKRIRPHLRNEKNLWVVGGGYGYSEEEAIERSKQDMNKKLEIESDQTIIPIRYIGKSNDSANNEVNS